MDSKKAIVRRFRDSQNYSSRESGKDFVSNFEIVDLWSDLNHLSGDIGACKKKKIVKGE